MKNKVSNDNTDSSFLSNNTTTVASGGEGALLGALLGCWRIRFTVVEIDPDKDPEGTERDGTHAWMDRIWFATAGIQSLLG